MDYNEVLTKVIYLTKRNNLSNAELGKIINVERRAMNGRATRNSNIKENEIKLIEKYYNINLSTISILDNSCKRLYDEKLSEQTKNIGKHLVEIQKKNDISDSKMAALLDITEDIYLDIKNGKAEPDFNVLFAIKQNFKVSVDWLLFGD